MRLFTYLEDAGYVSEHTESLMASFVLHIPDERIMCTAQYEFRYQLSGDIGKSYKELRCIPLVEYESAGDILRGMVEMCLTVLAALIFAVQLIKLIRKLVKLRTVSTKADENVVETETAAQLAIKTVLASVVLAAMVVWWTFALYASSKLQYENRYRWYDGDSSSVGRPLLLHREGESESFDGLDLPGAMRHTLPSRLDGGGVSAYIDLRNRISYAGNVFDLYFFMQSLVILFLIAQIFVHSSFQAKLHVISLTFGGVIPGLITLAVVFILFQVGGGAVTFFLMGDRVELFSTFSKSVEYNMEYVLGETAGNAYFRESNVVISAIEQYAIQVFWFFNSFLMLMVLIEFGESNSPISRDAMDEELANIIY